MMMTPLSHPYMEKNVEERGTQETSHVFLTKTLMEKVEKVRNWIGTWGISYHVPLFIQLKMLDFYHLS